MKKVARQLLAKLKDVLTEAGLDDGLPRAYTPDVFKAKAGAVFQHVYDKHGRAA